MAKSEKEAPKRATFTRDQVEKATQELFESYTIGAVLSAAGAYLEELATTMEAGGVQNKALRIGEKLAVLGVQARRLDKA